MANQEVDVVASVGNDTEGIKISATLANTVWPNASSTQIANDVRSQLKNMLVLLYVIRQGVPFDDAVAAIGNHVSDIH